MMQGSYHQNHQQLQQENILPINTTNSGNMSQQHHPQMLSSHHGGQQENMVYHQVAEYIPSYHNLQLCAEDAPVLSPSGSPVRQLKRLHPGATNTATELLRCKRRIDFMAQLGYPASFPNRHVNSVARRNERERNRVRLVNHGFALLRQHVPTIAGKAKKLSKVDTLRAAVEYIQQLKDVLEESDAVERTLGDHNSLSPASSPSSSPSGRHSPGGYSSDSSASSGQKVQMLGLESQDDDLADFSTWFC